MISFQGVTKNFGAQTALEDFSVDINPGEIVGFLGPNGAGKTTAMRLITGYLMPTKGEVQIDQQPLLPNLIHTKRRLGYLPEHNPLYQDFKVSEYLEFIYAVRQLPRRSKREKISKTADLCGLSQVINQTIATLSKGYKQRVGLAQALIHNPDILILDEPTSGLDPNQIAEIRRLIREIGKEKTVILSTHILPEVSAICNRAIILKKGKLAAQGSIKELEMKASGERTVEITTRGENQDFLSKLKEIPSIKSIEGSKTEDKEEVNYLLKTNSDCRADIFSLAVATKVQLLQLNEKHASLEEVFRELTVEEQ